MRPFIGSRCPEGLSSRILASVFAALIFATGLALASCAQTQPFLQTDKLTHRYGPSLVLVMPPDVELYELTAGGLQEPKADWTETGRANIQKALDAVLAAHNEKVVRYSSSTPGAPFDQEHIQLVKLHEAVGSAVLLHKYIPQGALPTKRDKFDYSLGPDVARLREKYGADYALFVFFRDSFASGGRMAVIFLAAALGVGVPGGAQVGFASLVDLRTGDVVWFNRLVSGVGDLREPDRAKDATESLFSEFPL